MGSTTIQSYTTISPLITAAHIINTLNKEVKSSILVNAAVRKNGFCHYKYRLLDRVQLMGIKPSPNSNATMDLLVYELLSEIVVQASTIDEEWMYTLQQQDTNKDTAFDDGIKCFFQGSFQQAIHHFDMHCASHPSDDVASALLTRSKKLGQQIRQINNSVTASMQYIRHWFGWAKEGEWRTDHVGSGDSSDHSDPVLAVETM
jgi:predicted transglutaminase-like cysteine proteinase